jgi:hypothetical protein
MVPKVQNLVKTNEGATLAAGRLSGPEMKQTGPDKARSLFEASIVKRSLRWAA